MANTLLIRRGVNSTLKHAVSMLVHANGGLVRVAELLDRSSSQVQRYCDDAEAGHHMPVGDVRKLEATGKSRAVTEFLAREGGGAVLWLDPAPASDDLARDIVACSRAYADLAASYCDALASEASPGRVDAAEARGMKARGQALMQLLAHLQVELDLRIAQEEKTGPAADKGGEGGR